MNTRLTFLVFVLFAFPALFLASEPRPIAAPEAGPMPGISGVPSIAFGYDGGFAAWHVGFDEIWGVPLDLTGRPSRPARLLVRDQFSTDGASVQWDGHAFVLWSGAKSARIDRDGNVLDTRTLPFSARPVASNGRVTIAFGGSGCDLVTYLLDSERTVLRSDLLTGAGCVDGVDAVVLRDGSFAIATTGWDGLYLTRFDPDGGAAGAPILIEPARGTTSTAYRAERAAVATDGETILVAWTGGEYGQKPQLKSVTVRKDNTLSVSRTLAADRWVTIAGLGALWTGSRFIVSVSAGQWEGRDGDDLDVYATELSRDGETILPDFVPVVVRPGLEMSLSMFAPSGRPLIIFQQGDYGMTELLLVDVPESLTRPDPSAIDASLTNSAAWQGSVTSASDGTAWLAAWLERTATRDTIRAVVLDRDGRPAASPILLAEAPRLSSSPQVAFNGIDYVVAWMQGNGIAVKRVSRDGRAMDEEPIAISTGRTFRFAMSARSGVTFFAWSDGAIHGATLLANGRVTPSVTLSAEPVATPAYSIDYDTPFVTAGNETVLFAWEERLHWPCTGIACPWSSTSEMRPFTYDLAPSTEVVRIKEGAPYAAASAGGTHLLVFDSGNGFVVDEASAHLSPPLTFGLMARPLSVGSEYVVADMTVNGAVFVRRVETDGTLSPRRGTDAMALPFAANATGLLLAHKSVSTQGFPYWGATAIHAQIIDSVSPDPLRRRATRR